MYIERRDVDVYLLSSRAIFAANQSLPDAFSVFYTVVYFPVSCQQCLCQFYCVH